jgi:hypothetical protein
VLSHNVEIARARVCESEAESLRIVVEIEMVTFQEIELLLQMGSLGMGMDLEMGHSIAFVDVVSSQVALPPGAFAQVEEVVVEGV